MKLNNRTHSAAVRLGFDALVILVLIPVGAFAQARIDWELVNPFPFIRNEEKMAELRSTYTSLDGDKTALDLERKLQRLNEDAIDDARTKAKAACLAQEAGTEAKCERISHLPYLGWFSSLAVDRHSGTCWNSSSLKFRSDEPGCQGYPNTGPERKIRAWVEGVSESDAAGARWAKDGVAIQVKRVACPARYPSKLCVTFNQPADTNFALSVELPSGQSAATGTVRAPERLVVGLGDSYASGEGNPDRPAQFMRNQSDRDLWWFWKWRRVPRRDLVDITVPGQPIINVEWLDRRCHRSMYSYQFKTALHMALKNPKQAITYVSYSCSGATTQNIHSKGSEQDPQEGMLRNSHYVQNGGKKKIDLQLKALKEAIGSREIDVLLLSTGGNDLGFAKYVADIVLSGKTRWLAGVFKQAKRPNDETNNVLTTSLTNNYLALRRAIFNGEHSVKIKGCSGDRPCDRIVLMPYPNVFRGEDGQVCAVTRNEFSMPFNRDDGRRVRTQNVFDKLYIHLNSFQLGAGKIDDGSGTLGWRVAEDETDVWKHHGFCSQATPPLNLNERFITPQRRKWIWKAYRPTGNAEIALEKDVYDPRDYKTYGARSRWIRLPIDSKLSADQRSFLWKFSHDFLFKDDRSSVMHPTAEAHAAMADMNLAEIANLP